MNKRHLSYQYKGYTYYFDFRAKCYKISQGDWVSAVYLISTKACEKVIDTVVKSSMQLI